MKTSSSHIFRKADFLLSCHVTGDRWASMTSLSWSVCWAAVTAGGPSRSLVSKSLIVSQPAIFTSVKCRWTMMWWHQHRLNKTQLCLETSSVKNTWNMPRTPGSLTNGFSDEIPHGCSVRLWRICLWFLRIYASRITPDVDHLTVRCLWELSHMPWVSGTWHLMETPSIILPLVPQ